VLEALWHFSVQVVIGVPLCAWRDEIESDPVPELQPALMINAKPIIMGGRSAFISCTVPSLLMT
jgi:hypothetical protein